MELNFENTILLHGSALFAFSAMKRNFKFVPTNLAVEIAACDFDFFINSTCFMLLKYYFPAGDRLLVANRVASHRHPAVFRSAHHSATRSVHVYVVQYHHVEFSVGSVGGGAGGR